MFTPSPSPQNTLSWPPLYFSNGPRSFLSQDPCTCCSCRLGHKSSCCPHVCILLIRTHLSVNVISSETTLKPPILKSPHSLIFYMSLCSASPTWCDQLVPVCPGPSQFYQKAQDGGSPHPTPPEGQSSGLIHSCISVLEKCLTHSRSPRNICGMKKEQCSLKNC